MDKVDTIISSKWLLDPAKNLIMEDHALVIDGNIIRDILPSHEVKRKYSSVNNTILNNHIVMPGLVNSNYNSSLAAFEHIKRINKEPTKDNYNLDKAIHNDGDYKKTFSQLSIIKMLKKGITTFCDIGIFSNSIIDEILKTRIRSCIGLEIHNKRTVWTNNEDECLEKALELLDYYKGNPNVNFFFNPTSIVDVSESMLKKVSKIANELDVPVRININMSDEEINKCIKNHGCRPLEYIDNLDIINNKFVAVNSLILNENDIKILEKYRASIIISKSTLLLSKNIKIEKLIKTKINIILSTDKYQSMDLDLLDEMSIFSLLSNIKKYQVSTKNIFKFVTINPAQSLGLDQLIGVFDKGYSADIVSINIKDIIQTNLILFNGIENDLKSMNIDNIWISGKQLLKNSKLLTINENKIYDKFRKINDQVIKNEYR